MIDNSIDIDGVQSEGKVAHLFADHRIPALSLKMTQFINSLNTTWKVSVILIWFLQRN